MTHARRCASHGLALRLPVDAPSEWPSARLWLLLASDPACAWWTRLLWPLAGIVRLGQHARAPWDARLGRPCCLR